jgi:hypothetical protein
MFFFEKKNQKTFVFCRTFPRETRDSANKVFCFFFSKKKSLPFSLPLLGSVPALC